MRPTPVLKALGRTIEIVLLVAVVVGGALALRLAAGPISLAPVESYLIRAIERGGPFLVSFDQPALAWSQQQQTVLLRVQNLEVRTKAGAFVAAAPVVALRLDLPALLKHGAIRLREVEVTLPALQLVRQADEQLVLYFGGHLGALPLSQATQGGVLDRLAGGANEAGDPRVRSLRRVRVTARSLQFFDEPSGRLLESGGAGLRLTREAAGWELRLDVAAIGGALGSHLRLLATPVEGSSDQQVTLQVQRLPVAALSGLLPERPLGQIAVPVSAEIHLRLDPAHLIPGPGTFRLTAPAGTVMVPNLFPQPIAIEGASLTGRGDAGWHRISLDEGVLRLPEATLQLAGTAERTQTVQSLGLDLKADQLDANLLQRLWPLTLAPGVRTWFVNHVDGGRVPSARLDLRHPAAEGGAPLDYTLAFAIQDGASRYLPDWPPATGLQGKGQLDRQRFALDFTAGRIGEVTASRASLVFTDLHSPEPAKLALAIDATGGVPATMELLAREPIRLGQRLGISPKATAGKVQASVALSLPLHKDLKGEEVTRQVTATLTDLAVQDIRKGYDVSGGKLAVKLDNAAADITGNLRLNVVPIRLVWHERLAGKGERRRIEASGALDRAGAGALGLPMPDGVAGTILLQAVVTDTDRKPRRIDLTGDLAGLVVDLPSYGLSKQPGEAGQFAARLEQSEEKRISVVSASASWPQVQLEGGGELRLDPASWQRVELTTARTAVADLSGTLTRDGGIIRADIDARQLDLRPYREQHPPGAGAAALGDLDLKLRAAQLRLGPEPLAAVSLDAAHRGDRFTGITAAAKLPGNADASFSLKAEQLPGSFAGETSDLGLLLRALDLPQSRLQGGRGRVTGQVAPGQGEPVWSGQAKLRDLVVRDVPLLARILTLASLQGLVDTLSGRGLAVDRASADFVWSQGRIQLKQARAVGSGLGVRVDGTIDTAARSLDLAGTVAPLYALNRLLGQIPIVGDLLRGEKADAAIAGTFSVRGTFDNPQVTVNPLAALIPGVIRDLFGDLLSSADGTPPPPERERQN